MKDDDARAGKKLVRRRACYCEVWWFDQVLVTGANGESITDLGEGEFSDSDLIDVQEVEEISPDDLDEAEVRAVAENIAAGEREQVQQMSVQEVREWLKKSLMGERQEKDVQ